ncbi:MAG TPA: tetratricopeptide repeat protein, partial [Pyrinomonadaceae bacterium]|nr:tetratricopeptide repeat protein [Pyrinomonadaceae bacterium]
AVGDFSKVIELDPQNADAYYNRGGLLVAQGEAAKAVDDFSKAIDINPQYAEAYADRGLARLSLGQDSEAQKDFDRYLELNKEMKDSLEQRIKYVRYYRDKKGKP